MTKEQEERYIKAIKKLMNQSADDLFAFADWLHRIRDFVSSIAVYTDVQETTKARRPKIDFKPCKSSNGKY